MEPLFNTDSAKKIKAGAIQSYIDTEDKYNYKVEDYIQNAINNTEIKDPDNDNNEVPPEMIAK